MSEPSQTSSGLKGLMEGPKKAPPPPGPRDTKREGGPARARLAAEKRITSVDQGAGLSVPSMANVGLRWADACMAVGLVRENVACPRGGRAVRVPLVEVPFVFVAFV